MSVRRRVYLWEQDEIDPEETGRLAFVTLGVLTAVQDAAGYEFGSLFGLSVRRRK